MIWLASYPRSGNTFFRNIMYHVYGLESGVYSVSNKEDVDLPNNRTLKPIIKTHLRPKDIPFKEGDLVIYLVRDGRDAVLSRAYRKMNMVAKGSRFYVNLLNFISTPKAFGTWSGHVKAWSKCKPLVIKFEDLVKDPLKQIERLGEHLNIESPNLSELPTFQKQKDGLCKYGSEENSVEFFRKEKIGTWKEEIPARFVWLFYQLHEQTLIELGYLKEPVKYSLLNGLLYSFAYIEMYAYIFYSNVVLKVSHKIKKLAGVNI